MRQGYQRQTWKAPGADCMSSGGIHTIWKSEGIIIETKSRVLGFVCVTSALTYAADTWTLRRISQTTTNRRTVLPPQLRMTTCAAMWYVTAGDEPSSRLLLEVELYLFNASVEQTASLIAFPHGIAVYSVALRSSAAVERLFASLDK